MPTVCSSDITRTKRLWWAGMTASKSSNIARDCPVVLHPARPGTRPPTRSARHLLARQRVPEIHPFQQGVECRTERLPPIRQAVLHLRRNLMVDKPPHDAVSLHLPQLLNQHLF